MKAETWETKTIMVKSDVIPFTHTTTEFALEKIRGQERVRVQQEEKSTTKQVSDEAIIHTLKPIVSGCEAEGHPEDEAAGEGVSSKTKSGLLPRPRKKMRMI